jgi:hypothetical protein
MFETFFGSEMPLAARFFIAFLVVLALIGLTAWLVRRFGAARLGGAGARGRQPRLAVIDAATVDGRRRLVLIRRDNIEHLLMIGGPTDVVVEQNIVRVAGAREASRPGVPESPARGAPAAETAWPLQPINEPPPVAPVAAPTPRGYRAAATEEPWLPPEPGARPRPTDSLTGMASEFSAKVNAPDYAPPPVRHEPPPMAPPPASAPSMTPSQVDQNLAEMAQQLEAALRRTPENRPPVSDPLAMQAGKPMDKPQEAARAPMRDLKPRAEPKIEPKAEPRVEPKAEQKFEPKFESKPEPKVEALKREAPKPEPAAGGKTVYDNLEEEMASLLGRPPGKT